MTKKDKIKVEQIRLYLASKQRIGICSAYWNSGDPTQRGIIRVYSVFREVWAQVMAPEISRISPGIKFELGDYHDMWRFDWVYIMLPRED